MAFNPNDYKPAKQKVLPVVLLLDVSSSMSGKKIESLYNATVAMIKSFDEQKIREVQIQLSIITFGKEIKLHTPFTAVENLVEVPLEKFIADGMTPLGMTLNMAKDMLEDKDVVPRPRYKPAVVLVSDGYPTDEWRIPLNKFISDGSTAKTQRFSVGIGSDYDYDMLKQFAGDDENMFQADTAEELASRFKVITDSISLRSRSVNPNEIKSLPIIEKQQHTTSIKIESARIENTDIDEDEDEFAY